MAEQNQEAATGTPPPAKKKANKRARFIILGIVLLILSILGAAYWYFFLRGYVGTDDAYVDSYPITISSKILGRIKTLALDEGDTVNAGQILIQLDDRDLRAEEAQAKADLDYVEKAVPAARVALDKAKDDYDRASVQYKNGVIPQEKYDHAHRAYQLTQAQYDMALSQVTLSNSKLEVVETELKNTTIESPSNGVVVKKWAMPGDIVQPGQPIFTIYDLDSVWITANFEETKIASIGHDAPVEIHVDAFPNLKVEGRVLMIISATASEFALIPPDNASGNFTKITQRVPVKIKIVKQTLNGQNVFRPLMPGMSVEVKIHKNKEQ
jgi:membrane fusion protein (multidrug efflux system)